MGHEDQFRPPSLNGGCRSGEATSAEMGDKEEEAPMADLKPAITKSFGFGPILTLALVSHAVTLFWVCDICGLI